MGADLKVFPDRETFTRLCRPGRAIPLRAEIEADTETPVSAFLKVSQGETQAFLFESVEGGERSGRWSFLGARPRKSWSWRLGEDEDPIARIEAELATHRAVPVEGTPRFAGGLVGYLSYDAVQLFEPRVPIANTDELGFPDAVFMDFDTVVAFDNLRHSVQVITEVRCDKGDIADELYEAAIKRIQRLAKVLARPLEDPRPKAARKPSELVPRVDRSAFEESVRKAREYIRAGDCQQIVLSQRFDAEVDVPPFEIYRALRRVNPSPYLYFVKDGDRALVGSSPETLVRVEEGEITLRPIAGTRRRGKDAREDAVLEADLKADPKENAEHVMLVDLGRNDVGRVAEVGTVRVDVLKTIERYSHVLHMVSQVRGKLAKGKTAIDVLRATFPAGTVSGAPKVRAMQIIDELEPARRGPYAGCLGYFDRRGNMEMAITIRTLLQTGRRVSVQAGAGLVFDSKPANEYVETVNKAKALFTAVAQAQARTLHAGGQTPRRTAARRGGRR
ncbi:MAG TPA: anthranilate synthase component I [Myxococcaceae bacterium]|nr:anthranilate synthase component I [Myxococcaceae bacterium]